MTPVWAFALAPTRASSPYDHPKGTPTPQGNRWTQTDSPVLPQKTLKETFPVEAGLLRRSDRVLPKLRGEAGRDPGRGGAPAARQREPWGRGPTACSCLARRRIAVGARGAHRTRPSAPAAAGDLLAGAAGGGGARVPEPGADRFLCAATPGPGAHTATWQVPDSPPTPCLWKNLEAGGGWWWWERPVVGPTRRS